MQHFRTEAVPIAPLGEGDFALFDCTASLHGYYSDVTRVSDIPLRPIFSLTFPLSFHRRHIFDVGFV